ncbi:MAG TPA: hypothetical protein GX709_01290 [Clostridiales bacterium]|nr:hypothetical protein [Clostridiales bacterium]
MRLKRKTLVGIYFLAIILLFFLFVFFNNNISKTKSYVYAQENFDPNKFELIAANPRKEVTYSKNVASYEGNYALTYDQDTFNGETIIYKLGDEIVENPINVGLYKVIITVEDKVWEKDDNGHDLELLIKPKPLSIMVSGANKYKYTGTKKERIVSILDENISDLEKESILSYNYVGEKYGDLENERPINVDKYNLVFNVKDTNYCIDDESIKYENDLIGLEILHEKLEVIADNLIVKYGVEYKPTYTISGFVEGEDENVLIKKPEIEAVFTKPGQYQIKAQNGEAANYTFEYIEGNLTINNYMLEGKINGNLNEIKVLGNFSPDCELEFKISDNKELIKERKAAYETRGLGKLNDREHLVFDITKKSGDFYLDSNFKVTISGIKVNKLFRNSIKIIAVDKYNKVTLIKNYSYSGENLSFSMPEMEGTVFILTEELVVALILFAVAFLILLIILFSITARINYKRKIKESEEIKKSKNNPEYIWSNKKRMRK